MNQEVVMTQQELNLIREVVRDELEKQSQIQQHLNQATNRIRELEANVLSERKVREEYELGGIRLVEENKKLETTNRSLLEECRTLHMEIDVRDKRIADLTFLANPQGKWNFCGFVNHVKDCNCTGTGGDR